MGYPGLALNEDSIVWIEAPATSTLVNPGQADSPMLFCRPMAGIRFGSSAAEPLSREARINSWPMGKF